ncbi:MAG: N-acetylmuramoyl-L-alanine amidase [Sphingobium sp.]
MTAYMDPNKISFITIHCAATPAGRDVKAATIGEWDRAKFGQISYHYVIELDGHVVPTLRHDEKGAHVGGHNTGNLGICYVGGMDANNHAPQDSRTPAQKAAMAALVKKLVAEHPGVVVRGHRDWPGVSKACPSFDVATWLKAERV